MVSKSILQQLNAIESEMKRIGFWSSTPPDLQSQLQSGEIKSFLDTPSFELWLQCIFIPNARSSVQNDSLPDQSQVSLMASRQYDYHSIVEKAQPLLTLLKDFDAFINNAAPN